MSLKFLTALLVGALAVDTNNTLGATPISNSAPGEIYDLRPFVLQLPFSDGDGIAIIKQPAVNTYSDHYFHVNDANNAIVMFVPENGVKTGNGAGPRTELTEPTEYFTFSGTHVMSYTTRVNQADHDVCIGQVKGDDYTNGSPLIIVEIVYERDTGKVYSHVRD